MSLRARLVNGPTIMLVGLELPAFFLGLLYFPVNVRYVLFALALQLPLFLIWRLLSINLELKSMLLINVSIAIRLLISWLSDDGPGDSISIGLLPLIIYYYVQYQRNLTPDEQSGGEGEESV